MGAGELSAALWQERRQLELLMFRLETQRLHVLAGNIEWLRFTASDVESALDRLRFEALARSVESAVVAADWGQPAEALLSELIAAAPPGPWPEILAGHLTALRELLQLLKDETRTGQELLAELRRTAAPGGAGPDSSGELAELTRSGNIERALAVMHGTAQPFLSDYLRDVPG